MQEQYWPTNVSLNFSPKTGRTIIFTLQLRVIKHRLMFCKSLSSSSKKCKRDCKILQQKKVIINVKADLVCRFSPSVGPFEAILLFLARKKMWKYCIRNCFHWSYLLTIWFYELPITNSELQNIFQPIIKSLFVSLSIM